MLFHEIYGAYFAAVNRMLEEAIQGTLKQDDITRIVQEEAFSESVLQLPDALMSDWHLLRPNLSTPILHKPQLPLTLLEKRWLKALTLDPRIRLFDVPLQGLEDIEPLFEPQTIVCFDRYVDGDPYEDATYIAHFHLILQALREQHYLRVRHKSARGLRNSWRCSPVKLEYSPRDDKFRLLALGPKGPLTFNLARITSCELLEAHEGPKPMRKTKKSTVIMDITNERNAMERAMLHFSHFERETRRLTENTYRMNLHYEKEDEAELLIRVLGFGPMVQVVSPESFVEHIKERLRKQHLLTL